MRSLLIEIVLNTDMQFHFAQVKNMRTTLSLLEADPTPSAVTVDKAKVLSLIVHSADVGHPGRCWDLHLKWTKMLCQEFFNQGDREKDLDMTVSPLCDRLTTNVASSQIGFIDFIVNPTFDVVIDMVERILNPIFQQHKAKAIPALPTVEESDAEDGQTTDQPEPEAVKTAAENDTLAGAEEFAALVAATGQEHDFIPFKWDSRLSVLKLPRFYAKNIESNKAMWRKHIEDEVNDPMFFKRFERDPVVELGWVWPDKDARAESGKGKGKDGGSDDKNDGSLHGSSSGNLDMDGNFEYIDARDERRKRHERQRQKIKEKESQKRTKRRSSNKHRDSLMSDRKNASAEGNQRGSNNFEETIRFSKHATSTATSARAIMGDDTMDDQEFGADDDRASDAGDLDDIAADDLEDELMALEDENENIANNEQPTRSYDPAPLEPDQDYVITPEKASEDGEGL